MKYLLMPILFSVVLLGCSTKPISNAGYKGEDSYRYGYQGANTELEELAVLGVQTDMEMSEEDIHRALHTATSVKLNRGSHIMLVQSGTDYPDSEMVENMSKYWGVSTLSGNGSRYEGMDLHRLLRFTAAKGGNDQVVVYWGVIESANENLHTKGVSWVPIVGWSVPDETTRMRVVLKFAVIDVSTGRWKTFQSTSVEDELVTSIINRSGEIQQQEIELKKAIYSIAVEQLYHYFNSST